MPPVAVAVETRSAVVDRAAIIGVGRAIVARAVIAVTRSVVVARAVRVGRPGRGCNAGPDRTGGEAEPDTGAPAPAARFGFGRCRDRGGAKGRDSGKRNCCFLHCSGSSWNSTHATTRLIWLVSAEPC